LDFWKKSKKIINFEFQWVVMKMGWLLSITVGTTAAESLNAAANIFLGQTEAPLLIKPFLGVMTK
jgi:pyrimidine nucleoside transport protein